MARRSDLMIHIRGILALIFFLFLFLLCILVIGGILIIAWNLLKSFAGLF